MARPKSPLQKPELSGSFAQQELDRAEKQFDKFHEELTSLTQDRMNAAPREERAPPEISQAEIAKKNEIYLKPIKTIFPSPNPKTGATEKFNESFREDYEFDKQYVNFVAENVEIGGEGIEIWTRPYGGLPAEYWKVPVNKPVWGPRYLAEQIKRCSYHRLIMDTRTASHADGIGTYFESMAVDKTVNRLDAHPVNSHRKSIFMGTTSF